MTLNIYKIAIAMLTEKDTFTYEIISKKVDLSNKTVRNNMNEIISLFSHYNIHIKKNPGIGIKINGKKEEILKCYKYCETKIHSSNQLPSKIRQNIISFLLLDSMNRITISSLERKLFITRPSIYNDLKIIEHFFQKYNISFSKTRKNGLTLIAGEKRIRHCLLDLSFLILENDISSYALSAEVSSYLNIINKPTINNKIKDFILTTAKETNTKITESDLKRASLFIQIAFYRMRREQLVSVHTDTVKKIKNKTLQVYLEQKIHQLAQSFHVSLPTNEMIYLIAQLSVYLCSTDEFMYQESSNPNLLFEIIHQYRKHIDQFLYLQNAKQFEKELFPFLEKTLQKFNFDYDCYNPSTELIIQKFPKLFEISSTINQFMSNSLNTLLPKDAIATITLLLASIQEKQANNIVCGYWSQEHQFKKKLFLNTLHTSVLNMKIIELNDETELLTFQGDFILSTKEVAKPKTKIIPIPALISSEFIHLLNDKIQEIRDQKRNHFFK